MTPAGGCLPAQGSCSTAPAPVAVIGPDQLRALAGDPPFDVRVFAGDQENREITGVEIRESNRTIKAEGARRRGRRPVATTRKGTTLSTTPNYDDPSWSSNQVNAGAWNAQSVWTDFSNANWPALSFVVPPSGIVIVTISAAVWITANTGTALIGWRMSGGTVLAHATAHAVGPTAAAAAAGGRASTSRRITGLTPGASCTITPGWWRSNVAATDGGDGQIIVQAG
jgi:hypothetical protein